MSERLHDQVPIKRALVSVYDKTGLDELVRGLHDAGVELVSTGGSATLIADLGLPVTKVEDLTGFPECLDGRVKTLHPRVHAGILADRRLETHVQQLADLGVEPFDLVVSNLYPFTATVASGASPDECVEQIDIGGPSMVRAAAKNHPSRRHRHLARRGTPTCWPPSPRAASRWPSGRRWPPRRSCTPRRTTCTWRRWMGNVLTDTSEGSGFPAWMGATWDKHAVLRYGENPHQSAAIYANGFLPAARARAGRASCTARRCPTTTTSTPTRPAVRRTTSTEPAVAIIKHANPCGIAIGADVADAHRKAHACDPVSAFGGVIATNVPVSVEMAEQVAEIFTEVVVAPGYEDGAVEMLAAKKNIRILRVRPAAARRRRDPADLRRPADPGPRRDRRRRDEAATTRRRGPSPPATAAVRRGARRPRLRLARLPAGQVQRDPARRRRCLRRRRHGPGQPRRLVPPRRASGPGSGRPAPSPPPTRSSRSPTARRC